MPRGVFRLACQHFKVLSGVVQNITVSVVHNLTRLKGSPDYLFSDDTMGVATVQLRIRLSGPTSALRITTPLGAFT
jgi:hypothetical protein